MVALRFLSFAAVLLLDVCYGQLYVQPEQVHLSYGAIPTDMVITWVTGSETPLSIVEYGRTKDLDQYAKGNATLFTDGGSEKRTMYIHRVTLTNLLPGKYYKYHCGSPLGWSAVYHFQAMPAGTKWSPRLAVFGDLGNVNPQSLPRLQRETQLGLYHSFLHVGDFAYNMEDNNARVGDEFMRQIETIAAYVPYMTCPGNHEVAYNFSNYVNRFSMPAARNSFNNHFYSWNIGPAHIVSFSTEFYFFVQYGWTQIVQQFQWLENDLREANKPENRAQRPWIITMGHKPMYCTNNDTDDCTLNESIIRTGIPAIHAFGLEDLFYKYGVDLQFYAHEHSYERLWPVYNRTVYNGSYENPYTNPKAPVHIITGSAGCYSKHDPFQGKAQDWSAFRTEDYGYTRMVIINKTHLFLEQVSDDQDGAVVDKIMLIKDRHGPEAWL